MLNVVKRFSGLVFIIFLVVADAVLIEILLDKFGVEGHRLFTGLLGVGIVTASFGYSLRKKKLISGSPRFWLFFHEWTSIIGTFILLVHTGTHFQAIVPVITLILTFVAFVSGLIGRYIYNNARASLKSQKASLIEKGLTESEIDTKLWGLAVASDALSKWRVIHKPIVFLLIIMVVYHATSALYYRGF